MNSKALDPTDFEEQGADSKDEPPTRPATFDDVRMRVQADGTSLIISDHVMVEVGKAEIRKLADGVYGLEVLRAFEKSRSGQLWYKDFGGTVLTLPPAPPSSRPGMLNAALVRKLQLAIIAACCA